MVASQYYGLAQRTKIWVKTGLRPNADSASRLYGAEACFLKDIVEVVDSSKSDFVAEDNDVKGDGNDVVCFKKHFELAIHEALLKALEEMCNKKQFLQRYVPHVRKELDDAFDHDKGLQVQFLTHPKNRNQEAISVSEQLEELCNMAFSVQPRKRITLHVDPVGSTSEVYE